MATRGLFVAVLGPDGVGKSTLVRALANAAPGVFTQVRCQHVRPRLFGRRDVPDHAPHGHGQPGRLRSLLKLGYLWTDYLLGYACITRPALRRGALCVSDRYAQDLLVDPLHLRCAIGGPLPRLLVRLAPRPDLLLVLDAPAALVHARKPELPVAELERQLQAYRMLAAGDPAARVLDAAQSAPQVLEAARACLAACLAERETRAILARAATAGAPPSGPAPPTAAATPRRRKRRKVWSSPSRRPT